MCSKSNIFFSLVKKCELNFNPISPSALTYNYGPRSVAFAYFNNDKWLDMVVVNYAVNLLSIFLGYGNTTFTKSVLYSTGLYSAPYMAAVGDFNNDHQVDIAVANFGTNSIGIFMGYGDGSFSNQTIISTDSSRPIWLHVTDLNNDTLLDIVAANYGTDSISVFYGHGDGNLSSPLTYSTGYDSSPFSAISGDFNNDNRLDLAIANYGTNSIGILLANDNETFSEQSIFSTGTNSRPKSIIVGYFNNNILLDIAVANYGTNTVGIFLGMSNGNFAIQVTYLIDGGSPYCIGVGDFNRDRRLDIAVANQGDNNIAHLLGRGDGTFNKAVMTSTGSVSSTSLAIGDLNNDSGLDITIISNDTNTIATFFSYDKGFQAPIPYSTGMSAAHVITGDFNNDGR